MPAIGLPPAQPADLPASAGLAALARARRFTAWLGLALLGLAGPVLAQPGQLPTYTAQLVWRAGVLDIDAGRSVLSLGDHAEVYRRCGLAPEAMQAELAAHLSGIWRQLGPGLEFLALGPPAADPAPRAAALAALRALPASDAATAELLAFNGDWAESEAPVKAWAARHQATQPPPFTRRPQLGDLYLAARTHPLLAEGPLLPVETDPKAIPDFNDARQGRLVFHLAPPLVGTDTRLRPVLNQAQWDGLRGDMAEAALKPLQCRLWYRQRIVDGVQDYLAVRGLDAQAYRAPRDASDLKGLDPSPAAAPPPAHHAGVAAERTRFPHDRANGQYGGQYGGRVLLMPDPLVTTVFVDTGEAGAARLWPALYLLLPSPDLAALRAAPQRYLCQTATVWKPSIGAAPQRAAVRLDLDTPAGQALRFSQRYLTTGELAVQLQRLSALGLKAGTLATDGQTDRPDGRRTTTLVVEPTTPTPPADDTSGLDRLIPPCSPASAPAVRDAAAEPQALPAPLAADQVHTATQGRAARPEPRHELQLTADKPAGQPARLGVTYSAEGRQPGERFTIGFGQQQQSSVQGSYSSDFVGFATLGRRVQLSASAHTTHQADRPSSATPQDERREGVEVRAVVDLWRDVAGGFGQAELALSRHQVTPAGAAQAQPPVTAAGLTLVLAQDRSGTAASPHAEAAVTLGRGQAAGRRFNQAALDLGYQRFVGAFQRVDLRLRAQGVGSAAPASEWVAFGGEDWVRGMRSEALLAQRAVALQAEYWWPWPGAADSAAIARLLRRNLALALLADLGRVSPALPQQRRHHAAVGLGLRFSQRVGAQRLTLKLDIAQPVAVDGALPAADRRARLHFSVGTQRSL